MRRFVKLSLAAAAIPAACLLYQQACVQRDRRRFLAPGSLIHIGQGRHIFLSQKGTRGPTVIFESGISATSLNWTDLQRVASVFSRAITYDRAGLGWSSPCTSERTPSNIVRELRRLLARAEIPPPYILVGHSFGGVVVRRFAIDHPDEVTGLVLIDPMRPEDWETQEDQQAREDGEDRAGQNQSTRDELTQGLRLTRIGLPCANFGLARLAITSLLCGSGKTARALSRISGPDGQRVFERLTTEVGKMPRETHAIVAAHWSNPHFYRGMAAHLRALPATIQEMSTAEPIQNIPIILLTPATAEPLSREALDRISPTAQQIIAEKSTHWVHLDEPALVLHAIQSVIEQAYSPNRSLRNETIPTTQ